MHTMKEIRMSGQPDVIYTWTDEAPRLATHALLPIIKAFARPAGVSVGTARISLDARIKAAFGLALHQKHLIAQSEN